MLWTIFIVFLCLWLLGLGTDFTAGGFANILLALAVLAVVVQLLATNRRVGK